MMKVPRLECPWPETPAAPLSLPIIGRWSFIARSSFIMARLPRLYAPRIPQLVQARFARPLALPDEPAPAASLDRIRDWLAEATQPASANAASGVSGASGATPLLALH